MATVDRERLTPPALTPAQQEMLSSAERMLMEAMDRSRAASITIRSDDGDLQPIEVPPQVLRILARILGLMARGQPIALVPERQELSTVEAANLLNVSRPFVVKEIEAGRLAHRMVGTHRRVLFTDLMEYAAKMRAGQQRALDDMAANARELGLYD
ncbi:MAG TPA: excisionase family DNA-binding protein [Burkholderiaceae bacterium]